jgi:hypothetical protein
MKKAISNDVLSFFRFAAITGFIVTATLIINLNFKVFRRVFKEKTYRFFWLFLILAIVPLLLIVYIFTLLFR